MRKLMLNSLSTWSYMAIVSPPCRPLPPSPLLYYEGVARCQVFDERPIGQVMQRHIPIRKGDKSRSSCIVVARVAEWGRVGPCGRHEDLAIAMNPRQRHTGACDRHAGTHPPRFQNCASNPCNSGGLVCAGTVTSGARMARVIPTNMVRRSIARNSSRSSCVTFVGTFPYSRC